MKKHLLTLIFIIIFTHVASSQNSMLWGTRSGSDSIQGTAGNIFTINQDGSGYQTRFNFSPPGGYTPVGNLTQSSSNGKLYGACFQGGPYLSCTIYTFDPVTNSHSDIYRFNAIYGTDPYSGLIQAPNGMLYGVAKTGGAFGSGVIYSVDPTTDSYLDIFDFDNKNGSPQVSPIYYNGKLYGTTVPVIFGSFAFVYSYDLSAKTISFLCNIDSISLGDCFGSMIMASNGKMYEMLHNGGVNDGGIIFSFDASTNKYLDLHDFARNTGLVPLGSLLQASDGKLYGTTYYGGATNAGVIFSFDITNNSYSVVYDFSNSTASHPSGDLSEVNGKLLGTTAHGGTNSKGVLFSYDLSNGVYSTIYDLTEGQDETLSPSRLTVVTIPNKVNELSPANNFSIYPNPAIDHINITFNNTSPSEIILYDLTSREILRTSFTNSTTINTANIAQGIYTYELRNKDAVIRKGKVLKF